MQAIVGGAYSVTFDLMVEGEYAPFDVDSTSYSIYDNSGAVISGYSNVAITTIEGQNRLSIEIPSGVHTVASGKTFEKRVVSLTTKYLDKTYILRQSYYVTPYLNYTVTPKDVIVLMGVRDGEVLEPEVDLVSAYVRVASLMGSSTLTTNLASGTITQVQANEAIKAQAALDLLSTIELKAFKKMGGDSLNYTRFDGIDFMTIRNNLKAILQESISATQSEVYTPPNMFLLTTPTDAVTGA